jgi:DnaK suppressor protein
VESQEFCGGTVASGEVRQRTLPYEAASVHTHIQPHAGAIVTTQKPHLEADFIERQRQTLQKLRATLLRAAKSGEAEEATVNSESSGGAREYEDDAQKLAMLELDGNLVARDVARLERIDRALKKIEEGTYGASDLSGKPIPKERLEAVPESLHTVAEEKAREHQG